MRGQKIFNDLIKENGIDNRSRKGRNNSLLYKRNEFIIARYYYYGSMKNKCYEEIIKSLVSEFFLSPVTLSNVIQENAEQLQALKQKGPALYYFQNRWPHIKW